MSSKKKKDTTSPRKEKEDTKGEKKKKKGASKDKHEEKDVHEKTATPRKEDAKGDKKKKKGSKHAKGGEIKMVVSEPLNVEKKEKKKKKKKGTKRGKANEAEVLHRGLSVAGDEGDNLLDALSTIANEQPVDEEKQYAEFVKKLTNDGDFEFPGESAPAKPHDSSSAKLDSIDDALAALENWDSESKSPPSNETVGDIAASELDALLAEMGQSLEEDEKKKQEDEENKKKREAEDRKKAEEEEKKKEEDRKEALRLEELKKAEEEKQRKEKEAEAEEKKKKEAEEEKKKKEKEAEEEKKKKAEAEKAKNSPATNSRKSQAFKIEIEGVRSAEPKKVEAVVVAAVEEDLPIADRVRKEFIETENTYVEGLSIIMKMYYRPLEISGLIRPKDIETIFYAVSQIHDIHSKLLVDLLDAENKAVTGGASVAFATVLAKFVPFLKIYTEYINHYDEANRRLNKLIQKEKKFAAFLKECQAKPECKSLDLSSYLISPIQRLPRYELLLRDYLKHSKDEKERKQIEALFNAVVDVNRYINQRKGDSELRKKKYKLQKILKQHKVDLFNRPDREYIKEGPLQICEIAEKEPKDLLAAEGSMRITQTISSRKLAKKLHTPFKDNYFFLFDDILIQVLLSHDDGEYNYKYVRHYATQSISVENVTLNSPAVGVLLDPVDETANGILLTWLTSEKSAEGDEFSDTPVASPLGRESTRMYMRRFYLKAAHPQEKQEWKEAIEKHSALSVDGIIDNKIKRGTIRLPGSPGLPSTPEEAAAYKDQMKRKYADEQRKSTILLQERKDERKFDAVEAERLLSTLETRVPVMDIFANRGSPRSQQQPTTTTTFTTSVPEVPATGDLHSQMALLDKELHTWETKRKEGTWGKSSVSPFAASARSTPPVPSVRLKSDNNSSLDFEKEVERKFSSATVNDDELSALLKSLDESDNLIDIREEVVSIKSTSTSNEGTSNTPVLARASSVSSSMNNNTTTTTTYTTQQPLSLGELDRLSSLERLQREQEAKVLEAQREAERVKRELELEKQREKERERDRIEREIKEKFERMQREEALKTAGVGALLCNFCFSSIGGAAYVKVGDKAYHADHFNCIVCGTGLAGKSFYPVGEDKKPHCTDCYDRLNAVQCHKCRRPITGAYTVVFEKNWHQECLVCVNCGCQFTDARADPSKRMMSKDDEPICKGCFGRTWSQNRKCAHCGQAVLNTSTDGKMSPTLDKCWHNECFICTSCSSHLTDPKWRDNKPYCIAHY